MYSTALNAIITNRNTAKRIKLHELTSLSRAKRGSTLIKKVKSTTYEIINAFITKKSDEIGIMSGEDLEVLKSTDIPIMDQISTGSSITKNKINYVYKISELITINESEIELPKKKETTETYKEMTMDDFINDFKL